MRVPISWLGEFVELPKIPSPADVLRDLVAVGFEEESTHRFDISGPVVVGQVLEFSEELQKNGKTTRWCQVRVAAKDTADGAAVRGIVCGAQNFDVGDFVVVALPGSLLPGGFEISARKTYGHVSDGMIASASELGLGGDHSGILKLSNLDVEPSVGIDAIKLLGLYDEAIEVNVTPDRGYALSVRGIAREYHHSTGAKFHDPSLAVSPKRCTGFPLSLDDSGPIRGVAGCSSFVARVVENVDMESPTPAFMLSRLALAGIRSISAPVDITNYVMLEMGQPIHAYDLDLLKNGISVRRANSGEKLVTLDGASRDLDVEDLVITDSSGPIGLAGVMGGKSTEISESTTRILIEAACFDPVSIARTQRRHKLPSEAAKRFARGVDPEVAEPAAERAVWLLEKFAGGSGTVQGALQKTSSGSSARVINLPLDFVESLTGMDVPQKKIREILKDIGGEIEKKDNFLVVKPPSWRPDLVDAPGLVEEIARIVGYDNIPSKLAFAPAGRGLTQFQKAQRRIAQSLAAGGLTEVLSYPFVSQADNKLSNESSDRKVRIQNPIDSAENQMRKSLLPGLLAVAHRNHSRGLTSIRIFETGLVFIPKAEDGTDNIPLGGIAPSSEIISELFDSTPEQPWHVGGLFIGEGTPPSPGLAAVATDVRDAMDAVGLVEGALNVSFEIKQSSSGSFHPGRYAEILLDGQFVGCFGELLPSLAAERDLPPRVSIFEINCSRVFELAGEAPTQARPLSIYPAATQDLSLVVDSSLPAGVVRDSLVEGMGSLLESIKVVDDYRGAEIARGKKSLTFSLIFRAEDRTLTQSEASAAKDAGVSLASDRHGAKLRG